MNSTKSGYLGILMLVGGILLFFLVLNYFNILSLSQLYPDKFASLPHQISYEQYSRSHFKKPTTLSKSTNKLLVNTLFTSNTPKNFTVTGPNGSMTFNLDKNTIYLKINVQKNPNGGSTSNSKQYSNSQEFFQQIKPGSLIIVIYSPSTQTPTAEQVQYISSFSL